MLKMSLLACIIGVCAASTLMRPASGAELRAISSNSGSMQVRVAGKQPLTFNESALAGLPRGSITAGAHDEKPSRWEGVALVELLRRAGAPLDRQLRGRAMSQFVRVTAADGYQVVFSLAELDPAFGDRKVLLVDRQDGHPLSGKDGPLRLVVAGDKRPARWVREVETIDVVDGSVPGRSSPRGNTIPAR
jgi:DMSO/TMAO reductase YedYZ molybdopterin-dependent catalytic subunit